MSKCTFFFGGSHNSCCEQHDKNYAADTQVTRREADRQLRECVIEKGHPVRAWVMWVGVRLFGWIFYRG